MELVEENQVVMLLLHKVHLVQVYQEKVLQVVMDILQTALLQVVEVVVQVQLVVMLQMQEVVQVA